MFLSETHLYDNRDDGLQQKLGFANGFRVGSFGRGGGLVLLWTQDFEVKVQSYDKLHIDVEIWYSGSQRAAWRFTGFYGESRSELRYRSWDLLKLLQS